MTRSFILYTALAISSYVFSFVVVAVFVALCDLSDFIVI